MSEELGDYPEHDGIDTDYFGNNISWCYTEDDGLITFFIDNEEITTWCCEEIEPSNCFNDFMKIWNMAQKSRPTKN